MVEASFQSANQLFYDSPPTTAGQSELSQDEFDHCDDDSGGADAVEGGKERVLDDSGCGCVRY